MKKIEFPKIWEILFIFGFILNLIHLLGYFLSLLLGIISWHSWFLDYEYFSINSIIVRLIFATTSFIMFFKRKKNLVLFNGLIWLQFWVLISSQMDKYIFISIPIIFTFSFLQSLTYKFKYK